MRKAALAVLCATFVVLGPALAQETLLRPKPRPEPVAQMAPQVKPTPRPIMVLAPAATDLRPMPRPVPPSQPGQIAANSAQQTATGMARSPRPQARPSAVSPTNLPIPPEKPHLLQRLFGVADQDKLADGVAGDGVDLASAVPAPSAPTSTAPRKGSVCGDRSIRGEIIGTITSKVKGCGVTDAVRVTEVSGIRLTQAVTVECGTVQALKDWIDNAMRPAFGQREVVQLRIAAHYVCRGRNNKRSARISEHGKGKALDISGFVFADGTEWSIKRDYNKQIRRAHKGACGIFGTTLGPGSDGYHEDHLHFDIARYRSGPYCR